MANRGFATNNLVRDHDIYADFMKKRGAAIAKDGIHNPDRLFYRKNLVGKPTDGKHINNSYRAIAKWHCIMLSYAIWSKYVRQYISFEGATEYKKSVNVPIDILKKFKKEFEEAIESAGCDYNKRCSHSRSNVKSWDACRYLAMYWTYLDIVKDTTNQRYFPDKETRERAAKIFGYPNGKNPFEMNGMYWSWGNKDTEEEKPVEEKTYSKDWFNVLLVDIIDDKRLVNPLLRSNIQTVGEFCNKTDKELLKIRTFGVVKLRKVREAVLKAGEKYVADISDEEQDDDKMVISKKSYDEYRKIKAECDELLSQKFKTNNLINYLKNENAAFRKENTALKEENQELKERNSNLSIAANPNNLDTFTLLNTVLEKMKHSKMEYILMTIDGMTIDIHSAKSFPLRSSSYQIRSSEVR